jgi:hypothetical protein
MDHTVITGADGVMVPLVTEEQKKKRRATEATRHILLSMRQQLSSGFFWDWSNFHRQALRYRNLEAG